LRALFTVYARTAVHHTHSRCEAHAPAAPAPLTRCVHARAPLQVPYLRGELSKRGEETRGTREELADRLKAAVGLPLA